MYWGLAINEAVLDNGAYFAVLPLSPHYTCCYHGTTGKIFKALNQPRVEDGIPRRQFTIVNNCAEQIRLGATGGFVKPLADKTMETCPDGSVLDEAVSTFCCCPWCCCDQRSCYLLYSPLRVSLQAPYVSFDTASERLFTEATGEHKIHCTWKGELRQKESLIANARKRLEKGRTLRRGKPWPKN